MFNTFGIDIPLAERELSNIGRETAAMSISVIYKLWFGLFQHNLLSGMNFNINTSVLI